MYMIVWTKAIYLGKKEVKVHGYLKNSLSSCIYKNT